MIWEARFLYWIQEVLRNPVFDILFLGLTYLVEKGIIPIILCVILLMIRKTRKIGFFLLCVLALSTLLNMVVLKNLFERARPYNIHSFLDPLVIMDDYSFPSGHTCGAFSVYFGLKDYLDKKKRIILCIIASLSALSRMYLGVHYPTDVVGGIAVAYFSYWLVKKSFEVYSE